MTHRRTTNANKLPSGRIRQMEKIIDMVRSEKPIERIRSLEQKIDEVDKHRGDRELCRALEGPHLDCQGGTDDGRGIGLSGPLGELSLQAHFLEADTALQA